MDDRTFAAAALCGVLALAAGDAAAGDAKSPRERELAGRLQQVQQQKQRLEQEKGELAAQVAQLTQDAQKAAQAEGQSRRDLASARRQNGELTSRLAAAEAARADLARRLEATGDSLGRREREKAMLESVANEQVQVIGRQSRSLDTCQARNAQLQQYGGELLRRLRDEAGSGGEPLLGLGRVEAFDAYQEYRDKFDNQRVDAAQPRQ